jgi:hypothetical protein
MAPSLMPSAILKYPIVSPCSSGETRPDVKGSRITAPATVMIAVQTRKRTFEVFEGMVAVCL